MPFGALKLVPGVDTEKTLALNEAGVSSSSFVRWREGMAEKRGGWAKFVNATFPGVPRALHAWEDINTVLHLAVGTTTRLDVVTSGNIADIAAQATTVSIAVSLDTTINTPTVTVHDTGRNATVYNVVVFNTPVAIGGLVLSGAYQVTSAGGANAYNITAASNATGSVAAGGAVPSFGTTSGSAAVTVTLAAHGLSVGSTFPVLVSTTVGGITFFGQYLITSVPTANTFTINGTNAATSTTRGSENGGNASLTYYITLGPPAIGTGFGIGGFGSGGFGTGTTPIVVTGTEITATDYWLDNWGEILISCPKGGPIFTWSPDSGNSNSAIIPQAPLANAGMFIAMPEQQIMAWGSSFSGVADPLQIHWSDAGDYTNWKPTAIDQAGGFRIPTGSQIIRGMQGSQQTLWWTDIDLYVGQYVQPPLVWGFNKISGNCGLIAPKAAVFFGTTAYWMSQKQFFMYGGNGVVPIDCKVWDAVFQNLNTAFLTNIRAGSNAQFNEISWDYPSAASTNGENDTRVIYNTVEGEWDIEPINRAAWIDQSVLGSPIGASSAGIVYQHEVSPDADGAPLVAFLRTGYFTLAEGEELVFVDQVMPDFKWGGYAGAQNATLQIQFDVLENLSDTSVTFGPYAVTQATPYIEPRFRGRYVQYSIGSTDIGSFWRLGRLRYRYASDGRVG